MPNINEDYVSFETAKLLKEKGFNVECLMSYVDKDLMNVYDSDFPSEYELVNCDSEVVDAPTLQMAMKWLREVHKVIPIILTGENSQDSFYYWFRIDTIKEGKWEDAIYREDEKAFPTYEQACEAAIKYCLKNLVKDEQKFANSTLEEKSRIDDAFTKMMLKKPTE